MVEYGDESGGTDIPLGDPIPGNGSKKTEVKFEKKRFVFTLCHNPKGRFVQVTEIAVGRYAGNIKIPVSGLKAFRGALDQMIATAESEEIASGEQTQAPD